MQLPAGGDDDVVGEVHAANRAASVQATPGYFAAGFTTWDVSIPDLSGIGFDPAWGLIQAPTT
jgi:hypothetical protein